MRYPHQVIIFSGCLLDRNSVVLLTSLSVLKRPWFLCCCAFPVFLPPHSGSFFLHLSLNYCCSVKDPHFSHFSHSLRVISFTVMTANTIKMLRIPKSLFLVQTSLLSLRPTTAHWTLSLCHSAGSTGSVCVQLNLSPSPQTFSSLTSVSASAFPQFFLARFPRTPWSYPISFRLELNPLP